MNTSLFDFAGGIQLLDGVDVTVALPGLLAGICLIGFVGNVLLLLVLVHDFRNGKASIVNTLTVNLSAIDLLILIVCLPIRAATYGRQSWTLGSFVCKTADWFQHCCLVAKSFTLAAVGQARYNSILNPPKFINFNPKRVVVILFFVWTVSCILPIPHMVFTNLPRYEGVALCVFEVPFYASNFMNVFSKIYPVAAYVIPIIFTATCYTKTLLQTKLQKKKAHNPRQQNKRITLMLVCVSGTYSLMWLPEWSAWVWARHSYSEGDKPPNGFIIFAQVFVYVSSAVSPIIFLAVSEDFREGLLSAWVFLRCNGSKAAGGSCSPKTGENGTEMGASVINSLQDLKTVSPTAISEVAKDVSIRILPDVEHFWQERRNTTATEVHDPVPWEREDKQ
ncbi:G-protein coupled receptor 151 [Megalops cyprinoides]|uniref:G-protein coupled receptor 151 n=1 Tax=Megalops cyprinoides TaxID=118141 RepID=UPI001864D9C9|nr:G-protein coupled receptor 151 [Megalops cyprinoides]